jgi:hypothetical protein
LRGVERLAWRICSGRLSLFRSLRRTAMSPQIDAARVRDDRPDQGESLTSGPTQGIARSTCLIMSATGGRLRHPTLNAHRYLHHPPQSLPQAIIVPLLSSVYRISLDGGWGHISFYTILAASACRQPFRISLHRRYRGCATSRDRGGCRCAVTAERTLCHLPPRTIFKLEDPYHMVQAKANFRKELVANSVAPLGRILFQ